ncbi:type III pantothenate kinase [Pokkaliibacter sp. CJK22405]|uniref:type III pantothenate kinase n=1 Tax=Pokkaliibacter sp. CJK22405 TaxID=3384615 RepID=UPI0039852904
MQYPQVEIDIGNTRTKWRVRQSPGEASPIQFCMTADVQLLLSELRLVQPRKVAIASVGDELLIEPIKQLSALQGFDLVELKSAAVQAGVVNAYQDPARMGVDRWMAMLGARRAHNGKLLVVSAGSALVLDVVDSSGQHLGGLIAPGLAMLYQSLVGNTKRIYMREDVQGEGSLGYSTETCVLNAHHIMVQGFINESLRHIGKVDVCVIGGGDAEVVAGHIRASPEVRNATVVVNESVILDGVAAAMSDC